MSWKISHNVCTALHCNSTFLYVDPICPISHHVPVSHPGQGNWTTVAMWKLKPYLEVPIDSKEASQTLNPAHTPSHFPLVYLIGHQPLSHVSACYMWEWPFGFFGCLLLVLLWPLPCSFLTSNFLALLGQASSLGLPRLLRECVVTLTLNKSCSHLCTLLMPLL